MYIWQLWERPFFPYFSKSCSHQPGKSFTLFPHHGKIMWMIILEIIWWSVDNFMVFKNSGNRTSHQVFNNNMVELRNDRLNFKRPQLQVNFIAYPDFLYDLSISKVNTNAFMYTQIPTALRKNKLNNNDLPGRCFRK